MLRHPSKSQSHPQSGGAADSYPSKEEEWQADIQQPEEQSPAAPRTHTTNAPDADSSAPAAPLNGMEAVQDMEKSKLQRPRYFYDEITQDGERCRGLYTCLKAFGNSPVLAKAKPGPLPNTPRIERIKN